MIKTKLEKFDAAIPKRGSLKKTPEVQEVINELFKMIRQIYMLGDLQRAFNLIQAKVTLYEENNVFWGPRPKLYEEIFKTIQKISHHPGVKLSLVSLDSSKDLWDGCLNGIGHDGSRFVGFPESYYFLEALEVIQSNHFLGEDYRIQWDIASLQVSIERDEKRIFFRKSPSYEENKKRLLELYNLIKDLKKIDTELMHYIDVYNDAVSDLIKIADLFVKIDDWAKKAKKQLGKQLSFQRKHGSTYAKAAARDKESRNLSQKVKQLIQRNSNCPYCGADISNDAHLDHIYPIARGGLSSPENMVYCCKSCNIKKGQKGLIRFLEENSLDATKAVKELRDLGKEI